MSHYNRTQRGLHWWVAIGIVLQYTMQSPMRSAMSALEQGQSLDVVGFLVSTLHLLLGLSIACFVLYRCVLRRASAATRAQKEPNVARKMASVWHYLLDTLVLGMVLSGFIDYYTNITLAGSIHEIGKWVLIACVVPHILVALWHHFWLKDTVLRQMLGISQHTDTMAD